MTDGATGSTTGVAVYQYAYDAYGNQVLIRDPMDNDLAGGLNKETTFKFDELGRQVERKLPDGSTETMVYNDLGQQTLHIDFEGRHTVSEYDSLGRRSATKHFPNATVYNGGSGTPTRTIAYKYDGLGRVIEVDDSDFTTPTTHEHDAEGRITKVDSPQGVIHYEYNDLGWLVRTYTGLADTGGPVNIAGDGEEITDTLYRYDELGRLTNVRLAERGDRPLSSELSSLDVKYFYDKVGNLQRMMRLYDTTGPARRVTTNYEYDALNRLKVVRTFEDGGAVGVKDPTDALIHEQLYTLQKDGKRSQVIETDDQGHNTTIDWAYDQLGRLTEERYDFDHATDPLQDDDHDYIARYGYDLASNRVLTERDFENALAAAFDDDESIIYTYDQNDRLITEIKDDKTPADEDRNTRYTYDVTTQTNKTVKTGTVIDDGTEVETTTMAYDVRGRLASITVDKTGSGRSST
ncbi:MAG: hypothetical protein AAGG08_16055, partial [Actinomycetota bacterium]